MKEKNEEAAPVVRSDDLLDRLGRAVFDREHTCRVLEDVQDRACHHGFPDGMSLSQFTDYLRGLYPEYYVKRSSVTNEAEGDERPSFCSPNSLVGLLEKAQKLNEIVEGLRSVRWNNEGFRLKDTREWCEFYVALKRAEREQANAPDHRRGERKES